MPNERCRFLPFCRQIAMPVTHGIDLDRIRRDRILHEALTVGPDPLHLALVFSLSHTTTSRYAAIAQLLLDGQLEQPAEQ